MSNGYTNHSTWRVIAHIENVEELTTAFDLYTRDLLRRVPGITDQTIGVNVKLALRMVVHDVAHGMNPQIVGWGDPIPVGNSAYVRTTLLDLAGDLLSANECEIGAAMRAYVADVDTDNGGE